MEYIFKEKIKYSEYEEFIKKQNYLSYMQEKNWANVKEIKQHKIIGVFNKNELCGVAHILIIKEKNKTKLLIPNGYLLDFNNKDLLDFMTENIKRLAKRYNAYVIDVYPNIFNNDKNINNIHNNLLELNYKFKDEYLDQTNNMLIPIKRNKKKLTKKELNKLYDNSDFYLKRGIEFEVTNDIKNIDRLDFLINEKYFDKKQVERLINNYEDRVYMIFCKLDLVFYEHYLKNNKGNNEELNKIQELLTISDYIDIGCCLLIEPFNKKNTVCELIYNKELESFEHLKIMDGLLYNSLDICIEKKYDYLKVSNKNLDNYNLINKYKADNIKYIGHYSLITKKLTYYLNKPLFYLK